MVVLIVDELWSSIAKSTLRISSLILVRLEWGNGGMIQNIEKHALQHIFVIMGPIRMRQTVFNVI